MKVNSDKQGLNGGGYGKAAVSLVVSCFVLGSSRALVICLGVISLFIKDTI
jgi:hypothetical protein